MRSRRAEAEAINLEGREANSKDPKDYLDRLAGRAVTRLVHPAGDCSVPRKPCTSQLQCATKDNDRVHPWKCKNTVLLDGAAPCECNSAAAAGRWSFLKAFVEDCCSTPEVAGRHHRLLH